MENCHPKETNVSRRGHWFSRGDNFSCNSLVQSIIIISYWILIKCVVYITLVLKQSRASEYFSLYVVPGKFKRSYDASKNLLWTVSAYCAQSYRPPSSTKTRCQVPSRTRAWFHDSASDIDFYQMSLSLSESTILHESIMSYISFFRVHPFYALFARVSKSW